MARSSTTASPRPLPAPPRPRAAATAERRAAILDAALGVFLERGVAAASVEEIRRRSSASIGSIYHHFGSKEGIAAALYVEALADYQEGLVAVLGAHEDARCGTEAGVHYHLGWIVTHADAARFLFAGLDPAVVLAGGRDLRRPNGRFFGAVLAWLRPRIEAGELRDAPPDVLHALWIGPSQELCRHWLAGRLSTSPLDAAAALAEAAWNSLRSPAASPTKTA
jgi:AcrR family transcriptional regulator